LVKTGFGTSGTIGETSSFWTSGINDTIGSLANDSVFTIGSIFSVGNWVLTVETSEIE
jgi:hypothetical protein